MISASDLHACTDAAAVGRLLAALGYPAAARPVDAEEWRRLGVPVAFPTGAAIHHLCSVGTVDLFAMEYPDDAREPVARLLGELQSWNPLRKQLFFHLDGQRHLHILDLGPRRRLRRCRIALDAPRPFDMERLNMIEWNGRQSDLRTLLDRALDRERIGTRFFRRFRDARNSLAAALAAQAPSEPPEQPAAQALLILSRILFLYFIQEKGWLNGERRFLADRLGASRGGGGEFFTDVMQPLFFGCLNTPRQARSGAATELGDIPYLNGGLFEPSPWERHHSAVSLPDELMASIIEELFERFSFSAEESEEEEALIDPEMLGKVFESLMESDERVATGSFYTPREVVDVLTACAIREWCGVGEAEEDLAPAAAATPLEKLSSIRVLDPACGSGAFLLSALRQIETLIRRLSHLAGVPAADDLRQRIVERSLFGVDLKPEAVRLCELRLWLAIVSASSRGSHEIAPLPNLDRNIQQGNSLLSPLDFLGDGRADVYRRWSSALRHRGDQIARYRHAAPEEKPDLCRELRESDRGLALLLLEASVTEDERELEHLRDQRSLIGGERPEPQAAVKLRQRVRLASAARAEVERGELSFFAFDLHFANVLAEGGFDVVLGNPPWIRSSRIPAALRRMCADRYPLFRGSGGGFRQSDLSIAFFDRALSLTKDGGVLSFLMPAKVMNARYARTLRRVLQARHRIASIFDWSDESRRLFEADTFPLGITIVRGGPRSITTVRSSSWQECVPQEALASGESGEWSLVPQEVRAILCQMSAQPPLAKALGRSPIMGVKTGANDRFFTGELTIRHGVARNGDGLEIPLDALCRCVRGRNIRRWHTSASEWMLWPPRNGWPRNEWGEALARWRGCSVEDFRLSFVRAEHLGTKVVWKDVARGLQAVAMPDTTEVEGWRLPLVPNQTTYFIDTADLEEAYVLSAVLNSKPFDALALAVAERAKDSHYRYFGSTVASLPFPTLRRGDRSWDALGRLARRAHAGADVQEEIDQRLADLYRIDDRQLDVLRRFVSGRLQLP